MDLEQYHENAHQFFDRLQSHIKVENKNFDLEFYKKITNLFHVGDYYFFIFNYVTTDFEYVSEGTKKILGYESSEINIETTLGSIHPDDREKMAHYERIFAQFLMDLKEAKYDKYKLSYDVRMQNKDGEYRRILHQHVVIQFEFPNQFYRSLNIHTDITDIKKNEAINFKIIGLEGEPSYDYKDIVSEAPLFIPLFTHREKEILALLLNGFTSKEIAEKLFISIYTVNNHRKNLLAKAKCQTVNEFILRAKNEDWASVI